MAVLLLDTNSNMMVSSSSFSSSFSDEEENDEEEEIVNEDGSKAKHIWWVDSSTYSDVTYQVVKYEDESMSCTCKGFEHHGWCKHVASKQ